MLTGQLISSSGSRILRGKGSEGGKKKKKKKVVWKPEKKFFRFFKNETGAQTGHLQWQNSFKNCLVPDQIRIVN